MIRSEEVYKIGVFNKPHGIKGELQFTFTDDIFDRVNCDYLICLLDGILVPFFIEEYRFRSNETALMKFCDLDSQDAARELTGCDVFFPRDHSDADEENVSWAEIVGYRLIDARSGREAGTIASVDDSTLNILFCLTDGKLIPANEELITDVDTDKRQITIDLPEGILDL
jgi:16S rRNA processing protein RimM